MEAPFSLPGGRRRNTYIPQHGTKVQFFSPRVCIIFIHVDEKIYQHREKRVDPLGCKRHNYLSDSSEMEFFMQERCN